MDRFQYFAVLAGCLAITLPLEFVFAARVYRRPRRLLRAIVPVVVVFYVWDAVAIGRGHWFFSAQYMTGWTMPFGVPVEEFAFFVVIPICALLSFEAVRSLLDAEWRAGSRRGLGVLQPSQSSQSSQPSQPSQPAQPSQPSGPDR